MTARPQGPNVAASSQGVSFVIHVSPRARAAHVGGLHGDALRVAVRAAPVEGEANRACVEALARALGLRRGAVHIASGQRGRRKRVVAEGEPERLVRRIRDLAEDGRGTQGAHARRE